MPLLVSGCEAFGGNRHSYKLKLPEQPGQQAWDEELFWWGRLFWREHYPSRQKLPWKAHLLLKEQLSWQEPLPYSLISPYSYSSFSPPAVAPPR